MLKEPCACTQQIMTFLKGRFAPAGLALAAVLLASSAFLVGWQWDDYALRLAARPVPQYQDLVPSPLLMFSFADGDPARIQALKDSGWYPWWTPQHFKMSFFRPLAAATHWLDFTLWPDSSAWMHLHSLLWFGLFVGAAVCLYRVLMHSAGLAGLAGLLFALDDAHGVPAGWLANRNALIASFFGLLTLFFHDRWRRHGNRRSMIWACLCLTAGLFGGEMALATGGYLLAYALFLDRGTVRRRLFSLVPCALVGFSWLLLYRSMGFGTWGSAWYVDPGSAPLEYLKALLQRGPILLFGQLGFVPSDLFVFLSGTGVKLFWGLAVAFLACCACVALPLLRRDRLSRFFAAGMVFSVLPIATTFPFDRLLTLVGFGAAGLLAQVLAHAAPLLKQRIPLLRLPEPHSGQPLFSGGRRLTRFTPIMAALLGVIHLAAAPLAMPVRTVSPALLGTVLYRSLKSVAVDAGVARQTFVFVNGPCALIGGFLVPVSMGLRGDPAPLRTRVLAPGIRQVTVTRVDPWTLAISPDGGFLETPDSKGGEGEDPVAVLDSGYMFQRMDRTFRDERLWFVPGDRMDLAGLKIEIDAVTRDGRPQRVLFRFAVRLEDPSLRWYRWEDGRYVGFVPPSVGTTSVLSSPSGLFGIR